MLNDKRYFKCILCYVVNKRNKRKQLKTKSGTALSLVDDVSTTENANKMYKNRLISIQLLK